MSQLKIKNGNNWESIPAGGIGVPSGGTTGQVLQKSSNTDYATEWADKPRMTLLWTNSTPSADFAPQTVSLDLSGYDMVFIEYAQDKANNDYYYSYFFKIDSKQHMAIGYYVGMMTRRFTTPSATGVYFNNGQQCSTYGSNFTTQNLVLIPINIYGIKI